MEWSRAKDVMLSREVLYSAPFQFKERTLQSVQAWQDIISKLMTSYPSNFERLTSRGAKEHMGLLIKNHKKKNAAELRASGISPAPTELDQLVEEIIQKMELHAAENEKEKEKRRAKKLMRKMCNCRPWRT